MRSPVFWYLHSFLTLNCCYWECHFVTFILHLVCDDYFVMLYSLGGTNMIVCNEYMLLYLYNMFVCREVKDTGLYEIRNFDKITFHEYPVEGCTWSARDNNLVCAIISAILYSSRCMENWINAMGMGWDARILLSINNQRVRSWHGNINMRFSGKDSTGKWSYFHCELKEGRTSEKI